MGRRSPSNRIFLKFSGLRQLLDENPCSQPAVPASEWYRQCMFFRKAQRGRFEAETSLKNAALGERKRSLATGLWFGVGLLALGCGGYCRDEECGCEGRDECIIDCQRDGCDIECAHTSDSCGVICGDDCRFECSETNHCSSYSGNNSVILCRNLPTCASDCGKGCHYIAEEVSELNVTVGDDSAVTCRRLSQCNVECLGACEVEAENVGEWRVECDDGTEHDGKGSGSISCD